MKTLIASILILLSGHASATEWIFGADLYSHHSTTRWWTNDRNAGLYACRDDWCGGAYENTLSRPSLWAGHKWDAGRFSLLAGIASGYEPRKLEKWERYQRADSSGWNVSKADVGHAKLVPLLSVSVAPDWPVRPRLSYAPIGKVLHLSVEF